MSTTSSRNFTTLYSGAGSAVAQGAYGNANVVSLLSVGTDGANTVGNITATGAVNTTGTISATGNITTAGFFIGNFAGNIIGNVSVPGANTQVLYNNAGNIGTAAGFTFTNTTGELDVPGAITAVGNIQGNYFLGNGSQLTGLPATYGNANVTTLLAAFGSNTISSTGNITTTANVAGNFFIGNGSQLTGLPATYGNANVAANLAAFGSNPISTTGNVTAGFFIGDGSQLTNLPAGTYGNANVANFLGNGFGSNTITTTGNITSGNSTVTTTLYVSNITGAVGQNVTITADGTGDIHLDADSVRIGDNNTDATIVTHGTGNLILRTHEGSAVEGNITVVNGVNGNIQLNPNGTGQVTTTVISATGNITGANLVATANLTSTQQTVVGTANVGTTGNIVVSGKNIATDMAFLPDGGTAATGVNGRVVIGTGWAGNISHSAQQNRLLVSDAFNRGNTATQVRLLQGDALISLTANVTNGSMRNQAAGGTMRIGGGTAANTISLSQGPGNIFSVAGGQFNVDVGNISPYNLGNTTISHAAVNGGALQIQAGSTVLNAFGINNLITSPVGGSPGNIGNIIGYSTGMILASVPSGNVYGFYHGSNATSSTTGVSVVNQIRQAPQYYAFYNADDLAQIQLGSLRRYHEFETATATSGSFAIDKNTAQVHNIAPTGNCTITGYSNMVTSVSDGSTSDAQVDTLTIIVEQGATPYTVTLPTGATYKYAANISSVGATANAVTMISVTAANVRGTVTYLTTVSPEFV